MLKVVHIPFGFAPDPPGGTEIYVEALANDLRANGVESLIVAPSSTGRDEAYEHKGLRVRRFRSAAESKHMLRELYGAGDPVAAAAFAAILDEERPDAVHLHAFTRAVSLLLVRAAKERGLPVFFTYHTPTASCQRGTLMRWGREVCDGALRPRRCASCSLEGQGMPRAASILLSCAPFGIARSLETMGLAGGVWTALRMTDLVRLRQQAFRALVSEADGVVALSNWSRDLLVRNGVSAAKITLSRHGLPASQGELEPPVDVWKKPLRVAFLGRADKTKGADTLLRAVRAAPELDIEAHLYGVVQSGADGYWNMLKSLAADDGRISFLPPVPHAQIIGLLRRYHLLAAPSRWLETGPLVALEAFAAGTPVIGSRLGGIAEWIRDGENGLLIEADNVQAWADALRRCAEDRELLARLRQGVQRPRDMTDVAREMARLYRGAVKA